MKDKDMITIVYEAQASQDYGWGPMSAVPPKPTLEEAKHEALYYLQNWPRFKLRVVKKTIEVVWVQEEE